MRLFVALPVPEHAVGELERAVAPLRDGWPGLRWTGAEAWHLTLAFLGEADEAVLGPLATRLSRAAGRHSQLTMSLRAAGAFPRASSARVLWAGVQADLAALPALAHSVIAAAGRAGAPPASPGRAYHPHLTLARCRREPLDVGPLVDALSVFAGTPWTATQICLINSRLTEDPRYQTLGAWPLRAPGDGPLVADSR